MSFPEEWSADGARKTLDDDGIPCVVPAYAELEIRLVDGELYLVRFAADGSETIEPTTREEIVLAYAESFALGVLDAAEQARGLPALDERERELLDARTVREELDPEVAAGEFFENLVASVDAAIAELEAREDPSDEGSSRQDAGPIS